jgi:hypothetical protein
VGALMGRALLRKILPVLFGLTAMTGTVLLFQNCAQGLPDTADENSLLSHGFGTMSSIPARSCKQIRDTNPKAVSGVYYIDPDGIATGVDTFQAYCDLTTDGGGWMLVARNDQTTSFTYFNHNWAEYKAGFGDLTVTSGRGWLGNARLNALTAAAPIELKVADNLSSHFYDHFSVDTEANKYKLAVASTAASNDNGQFATYSGSAFTTPDADNDTYAPGNCATMYSAGWWYGACYAMSIAGSNTNQVYWRDSAGNVENAAWIEMWVR